ncbi:hypothetical protein [Allocoleopsis sp.]|uniref:hypothetical protein n=1 Tax=Allocoleopsis sp. TaxID=3088169 RepID=UPI002FD5057A
MARKNQQDNDSNPQVSYLVKEYESLALQRLQLQQQLDTCNEGIKVMVKIDKELSKAIETSKKGVTKVLELAASSNPDSLEIVKQQLFEELEALFKQYQKPHPHSEADYKDSSEATQPTNEESHSTDFNSLEDLITTGSNESTNGQGKALITV